MGNSNSQRNKNSKTTKSKSGRNSDFRPRSKGFKVEKEEPRKDSRAKRVNLPNERTSKFVRNFVEDMEEGSKRGNNNDISTWNKSPQYLQSAGSLPFASIVGEPLMPMRDTGAAVPGIMILEFSHAIGSAVDATAVNKCFEAVQSFMIHANSRDYTFDFPDTAMYIMAGADVYAAIEEAKRIYGLYKAYQEPNRYLVDHLVSALGWNPEDTRNSLGQMWFDLNDLILQSRQIWIPNTMPFLMRWIDLNRHVYKDAESERAQIYALKQNNYWELTETGSVTGTALCPALYPQTQTASGFTNWTPICDVGSPRTWKNFKQMIQRMINLLVASQDRASIYGDILKAYGGDKIFAMEAFDASYSVVPETNAMILAQFENATISGLMCKNVLQDPNGLLSIVPLYSLASETGTPKQLTQTELKDLLLTTDQLGTPMDQVLNYHGSGQPTPEWIMEATRFKAMAATTAAQHTMTAPSVGNASTTMPTYSGGNVQSSVVTAVIPIGTSTEIINTVKIYTRQNTGIGWLLGSNTLQQYRGNSDVLSTNYIAVARRIMAFDWHPFLYDVDYDFDPSQGLAIPFSNLEEAYGDFDNYLVISSNELDKLHKVAIYSAFNVPMNIN